MSGFKILTPMRKRCIKLNTTTNKKAVFTATSRNLRNFENTEFSNKLSSKHKIQKPRPIEIGYVYKSKEMEKPSNTLLNILEKPNVIIMEKNNICIACY